MSHAKFNSVCKKWTITGLPLTSEYSPLDRMAEVGGRLCLAMHADNSNLRISYSETFSLRDLSLCRSWLPSMGSPERDIL